MASPASVEHRMTELPSPVLWLALRPPNPFRIATLVSCLAVPVRSYPHFCSLFHLEGSPLYALGLLRASMSALRQKRTSLSKSKHRNRLRRVQAWTLFASPFPIWRIGP